MDHFAPAILHVTEDLTQTRSDGAAVLTSGAGGGVSGPGCIYPALADKIAALLCFPTLRLNYRQPARNKYYVPGVLASFAYLYTRFATTQFILVGWSLGGAPCVTVAAADQRVKGVAAVASQTAETEGIRSLSPRPVLIMHWTGDTCLSPYCARRLYEMYGHGTGKRLLKLFEEDDHGLKNNSMDVERLMFDFAARVLGRGEEGGEEGIRLRRENPVGNRDRRVRAMEEEHDLENESL